MITLNTLSKEREIILNSLSSERIAAFEDINRQRIESFDNLKQLTKGGINQSSILNPQSSIIANNLVDKIFIRLLILLVVAIIGITISLKVWRIKKS